jgi:hypothetical protein
LKDPLPSNSDNLGTNPLTYGVFRVYELVMCFGK